MFTSWKFKVACAYLVLAAGCFSLVACCTVDGGAKSLSYQPEASKAVNTLPEAAMLAKNGVTQVAVLCAKNADSHDEYMVQIDYWSKDEGAAAIYIDAPCKSWNQLLSLSPTKFGWQVNAVNEGDADLAPDVIRAVARHLGRS